MKTQTVVVGAELRDPVPGPGQEAMPPPPPPAEPLQAPGLEQATQQAATQAPAPATSKAEDPLNIVQATPAQPAAMQAPAPVPSNKAEAPPDTLQALLQESVDPKGANEVPAIPEDMAQLIMCGQSGVPQASAPEPPQLELDPSINTSTHRQSAMRLKRFMESEEGAKFPHMSKLWEGSKDETLLN